jgi:hypothetical protein
MVTIAKDTPIKVNLKYVIGLIAIVVIGLLISN